MNLVSGIVIIGCAAISLICAITAGPDKISFIDLIVSKVCFLVLSILYVMLLNMK